MLCCVVLLNAVLCAVLCRDVLGLWCPEGLIEADTETGCITALMKSVSTDCTQGQLVVQQHHLPQTQERERVCIGVGLGGGVIRYRDRQGFSRVYM